MNIKLFLKRYSLIIISCFLIFIIFLNDVNNLKINEQKIIDAELNWRATCLEDQTLSSDIKKLCQDAQNNPIHHNDFFTYFSLIIYRTKLSICLLFIVVISVLYFTSKEYKNRVSLNYLSREKYSQYLKRIIFNNYKFLLFFPLLFFLIIIYCAFTSKGFSLDLSLISSSTSWTKTTLNNPILFILCYLINLFFHLGLYTNICLCLVRKNHNFFIALILSIFTIFGIELFFEIGINALIFGKIFHSSFGHMFNILNWLIYPDIYGTLTPVLMSGSFFIISFIVFLFCYKDKEKFIIDLEKNN